MPVIAPLPRSERRLMQKTIHKTRDKNYARRLIAMLMLHRGDRVSDATRTLCCPVHLPDAGLTGLPGRALKV
ncbi:transposase [Erwinia tracheiphila]|uniref:Transposase n=1 Tax=Erwinia tracheiphila TaxID=65700 RepID=A0A0M2KBM4_9GAMM|nr:hypothetical protein ETR_13676 [Erwinia tracheiphila PSU-1]KKF36760.1 transposase [Erwinia tracheiphila]